MEVTTTASATLDVGLHASGLGTERARERERVRSDQVCHAGPVAGRRRRLQPIWPSGRPSVRCPSAARQVADLVGKGFELQLSWSGRSWSRLHHSETPDSALEE